MELSDEDFDRLERLARLKESGSITECEFADMKRHIVDEQPRGDSVYRKVAIDVTEETFETEVLEKSKKIPVVVDLWAEWCGPCKTLGPLLEKVIDATGGKVVLAKVDVDANPGLSQALKVQSIPAVYALYEGRVVDGFMGEYPESAVQEFVDKLLPTGEKLNRPARVTIFAGLRSTGYIETYGGDTRLLSGPSDPMKIYWAGHKIGKLKGFDTFSFDIESAGEVTVKSRGRTTQIFLGSHADSEVRFRTEDGDAVTAEVSYRRLG